MKLRRGVLQIGLAVAGMFVIACATAGPRSASASALQRSDTRAKVIETMGEPDNRQFSGDDEALQYCRKTGNALLASEAGEYTVVWLHRGFVTGVTTYNETLLPLKSCKSAFRPIRWEEAPDREAVRPPQGQGPSHSDG